jgi:hypothetical protein
MIKQIELSNEDEVDWQNEKAWIHYWELQEKVNDYLIDQRFVESQKDSEVQKKQLIADLDFVDNQGLEHKHELAERIKFRQNWNRENRAKAKKWKHFKV